MRGAGWSLLEKLSLRRHGGSYGLVPKGRSGFFLGIGLRFGWGAQGENGGCQGENPQKKVRHIAKREEDGKKTTLSRSQRWKDVPEALG